MDPQPREGQTKLREAPGGAGKEFILRHYTPYELKKMSWNLQLFADGGENEGKTGGTEPKDDKGDGAKGNGDKGGDGKHKEGDGDGKKGGTPRTYTDADVDAIVAKKFAKWQKDHEKDLENAKEEGRKYERMSKEQREEADREKEEKESARKDARIKELEGQIATNALRESIAKEVEAMPEGITASQDFLDLVVAGDEDAAKANVDKLVGLILADRKVQEGKRAKGTTPKSYSGNGGKLSPYERVANKYRKG